MKYEAGGERWDVYLSEETPTDGIRSLIFHCVSNSSHGWRVAQVPASEFASQQSLERLEESDLDELYRRSQPFDYAHDPTAVEGNVRDHRPR
jgi:hypothetical protein